MEYYLLPYFVQKQSKEYFFNFGVNSYGPPFGKIPIWPLDQIGLFYSLGGVGF